MNRNLRCQPEEIKNCCQDTNMRPLRHSHTHTRTPVYNDILSCWLSDSGHTRKWHCHNKVTPVTTA